MCPHDSEDNSGQPMRPLHGAIFVKPFDPDPLLKRLAMPFDKLHVVDAVLLNGHGTLAPEILPTYEFLENRGFIGRLPDAEIGRIQATNEYQMNSLMGDEDDIDYISRQLAGLCAGPDHDTVGICLTSRDDIFLTRPTKQCGGSSHRA
jgi:hypothetical protein